VGALVGAGLFLGTAYVGGFGACPPATVARPAFEVANAPARLIAEVWTSGPIHPQQMGHDCYGTFVRTWNPRDFALAGLAFYGLCGGIAAWLWRFGYGDR